MKKIILVLVMLTVMISLVSAQNTLEFRKADFNWSVSDDMLTIEITASTKGWIAVGLGTSKMDGSAMFMGYYDDGEAFFEEHLGKGHSHKKVDNPRPVEYSVVENDGETTLEFTVALSEFVSRGQSSLPVIIAYGARDNFTSIHRYRDSGEIIF